ncbi:hypothetical protein [Nocardia altamirensis]|uniref:hypothetical protein n=1 Tax=Nocardia altamirensis TaxID=472158 RepID=UPI00084093D3|nr:hypothetical protein [Nocardia altamirensis]
MPISPTLPSAEEIEAALERAYSDRNRCNARIAALSTLGIAVAARRYLPAIRWVVLTENIEGLSPVALCDGRRPDLEISESDDDAVHTFINATGLLASNITDPEAAGLTRTQYNNLLLDLATALDTGKSWLTNESDADSREYPARPDAEHQGDAEAVADAVPANRSGDPVEFSIDDTAFATWITDADVLGDAPTTASDAPASDLLSLLDSALLAGVVVGAPRWELLLDVDNAARDPGFHLILRTRATDHITAGYTLGFTPMDDLCTERDTAPAATVRRHLDHVIAVANATLGAITGHE